MESLILTHFSPLPPPPSSHTKLLSKSLNPSPSPSPHKHTTHLLCSSSNSIPSTFNGWDNDLSTPTTFTPHSTLQTILTTLGLNQKQAITFSLGFITALLLFRSRPPSIIVIPVSVTLFVAGFVTGAAKGMGLFGLADHVGRRGREMDEKAREVGVFLDELGEKMSGLKDGLEGAIERNCLDVGSVRSYLDVVEVVKEVAGEAKKSIEEGFASQKGNDGFEFVQQVGSMFEDYFNGSGPQKPKGGSKRVTENGNDIGRSKVGTRNGDASECAVLDDQMVNKEFRGQNVAGVDGERSQYSRVGKFADDVLSFDDELSSSSRSSHSRSEKRSFEELVYKQIYKGRSSKDDFYESAGHGRRTSDSMDFVSSESGTSSLLEETLETNDKSYFLSRERKTVMSRSEHGIKSKQSSVYNEQRIRGMEEERTASSSETSENEEFSRNVKEATNLLKLARECLLKQADEEKADSMLYKSASLLSKAVALNPTSLLAMGQLGNTYLLHGELKLRISRELRTLILRSDGLFNAKQRGAWLNTLDTPSLNREDITSGLVDVCEECDGLLVEAGRKYRKALVIDGNDIRALYNWGLALSYRAQLIADIGPEAAIDADKVYLAAIEKFNAMMSRSNDYAPDALYRWGLALQQRSLLRPDNSREKTKLLHQAKSLFEDVLSVESDNKLVREALSSCLSELDYTRQW